MVDGWTGGGSDGGAADEEVRNGLCRSERVPEPVPFVLVLVLALVFVAALADGADEGEAELEPGK